MFAAADRVEISVTFTWDLRRAEKLAREWEHIAPVTIGGPATGQRGEEFLPGKYLKKGYVITSRGCPNHCWFCSAWKRDGHTRVLPVQNGWNVLDDNLLACPKGHIRNVFHMLQQQNEPAQFTGGFEAKRFCEWHLDLLAALRFSQIFFAYDTPDDWEPLENAAQLLNRAGLLKTRTGQTNHKNRCYVLIGYPGDSQQAAARRLRAVYRLGFVPMAMLWQNDKARCDLSWRRFQRVWARPASITKLCSKSAVTGTSTTQQTLLFRG